MSAKTCAVCKQHPAIYIRHQRRGATPTRLVVGARKDHDLCPRCHRALENRMRLRVA